MEVPKNLSIGGAERQDPSWPWRERASSRGVGFDDHVPARPVVPLRKLYQDGRLSAVKAGGAAVPASALANPPRKNGAMFYPSIGAAYNLQMSRMGYRRANVQNSGANQRTVDRADRAKSGMQPSTRRNREQRIREILDTARQVFQEDGYAGFTIRRVADRMGITHGNLQYYFRTTEELLRSALPAYMSQIMDDYTVVASRPGTSAAQRCSALVNHIFQNINGTDLPKFMVEVWAFASHEAYVAELLSDMQAQFRGIFAKLLSELHPTLTSEACLVRAAVIGAQMDGMTIFASHGNFTGKDSVDLARVAKRTVKMVMSASPGMPESETTFRCSRVRHRSSGTPVSVFGSEGHLQPGQLDLRVRQPAQDAFHYRPTAQGKRREIKINEIVSTATNLLATEGYANFTLARVARELGILPSALQNYFPTHDDLLNSTVGAVGQAYLDRYAEIGKPNSKAVMERLCDIAVDVFEEACVPAVQQLWPEMWALARHSDVTLEIVRNGYAAYRVVWADLIREIDSSTTARECLARATLIAALLDGVTLLKLGTQNCAISEHRAFDLVTTTTVLIARGPMADNDMP